MDRFLFSNKLYDLSNYYSVYMYCNIKIIVNNNKKFKFLDISLFLDENFEDWIANNDKILKKYNIIFDEINNINPKIDGLYTNLKNINMLLLLLENDIYSEYITNKIFNMISINFTNNKQNFIELLESKNKYNEEIDKLDDYIKILAYELPR
ncbi:unknown similar to AMEV206 [Mythimna separata entomopoxvirus 'L']|uniref:Uncharacterized protein n=1 Tax=Mythimna separata entomopoxvirus 'L' TaxID=1293572 RepID=A0A916KQR6_9POXV|nr:unknown similar to AMEV206 [Mythimna separata entomopoxvirus 'L']CCU56430.1 unknown similar to AMEV206 [Mythimna separata entomopoxvirus 'L']